MTSQQSNDSLYQELLDVSVRLGEDSLQVQAAGGNTSLKSGDTMYVKASGKWLAEARREDIMTPIRWRALRQAMANGAAEANVASHFVLSDNLLSGLRPSIETSLHAALPWPAVIHTHCVATIAVAVRTDAEEVMRARLDGMGAVFIPYAKPGLDLSDAIVQRIQPATQVVVLGNHGLVVCGDTPRKAETLLRDVSNRLEQRPVDPLEPDAALGLALAGTGWKPADDGRLHAVARDPTRLEMARGAALYPDHVIFLGPGVSVAKEGEAPADAVARIEAEAPARRLVLFPGLGAAQPEDASPSARALAKALGDVIARIEPGAVLKRLTREQELELLNWDAEKYRQALDKADRTKGTA